MQQTIISSNRLQSIDLLRGIVIILMALDHVRDYIGPTLYFPTDLAQTSILLFLTRWITHFCAPIFFLLSGFSAYLYGKKYGKLNLAKFLLTRGLWLIILELTVISFSWTFSLKPTFTLQVIWSLGWSMILLSVLIWLPKLSIMAISLLMIGLHNLFDLVSISQDSHPYLALLEPIACPIFGVSNQANWGVDSLPLNTLDCCDGRWLRVREFVSTGG